MATRTCGSGVCDGTCAVGFLDLNGNKQSDGCEATAFTGDFTGGAASPAQCADWQAFATRLSASTNYTRVSIQGTNDPAGISCVGATANTICQALRLGTTPGFLACGGRTWTVSTNCGAPGSVELGATGSVCSCNAGYVVRPCVGSPLWGGVNGATCNAPSQSMTVTCTGQ
jgi:hypothetical protein